MYTTERERVVRRPAGSRMVCWRAPYDFSHVGTKASGIETRLRPGAWLAADGTGGRRCP